jgi:hypothetical protein
LKKSRNPLCESFDKTFSKVFRAPAANRRSPSAEGEIPLVGVSFLRTFFFAPMVSKKKVAKELTLFKIYPQKATPYFYSVAFSLAIFKFSCYNE